MDQRGQGMTEYIIMVALIAIAAISIYTLFGKQIRSVVAGIGGQLAGNTDSEATSYEAELEGQAEKTVNLGELGNEEH
jgi:Flp pilus assembly pilin Flp